MNIKWLERKSYLDTNSLEVEWLGAEDAKQEDSGSSSDGREACVFRAKNCVTCDCLVGPLPTVEGLANAVEMASTVIGAWRGAAEAMCPVSNGNSREIDSSGAAADRPRPEAPGPARPVPATTGELIGLDT
jgi:hypothetical protein